MNLGSDSSKHLLLWTTWWDVSLWSGQQSITKEVIDISSQTRLCSLQNLLRSLTSFFKQYHHTEYTKGIRKKLVLTSTYGVDPRADFMAEIIDQFRALGSMLDMVCANCVDNDTCWRRWHPTDRRLKKASVVAGHEKVDQSREMTRIIHSALLLHFSAQPCLPDFHTSPYHHKKHLRSPSTHNNTITNPTNAYKTHTSLPI